MAMSTRDRLIEEATTLFYNHGFHAVGLDRVIDAAGVTKTTFYNHFESKDDLIVEVLHRRDQTEMSAWRQWMRERGGVDPRGQILSLFDLLREWFRDEAFRGCMFMNAAVEFPAPNDPVHVAAARHSEHLYAELRRLAVDAEADDADLVARQVLMLLSGALLARHVSLDTTAADTARAAAEAVLDRRLPTRAE